MHITVDITEFYSHNIVDSCSVSNLLSSYKLFAAAKDSRCTFHCTSYVQYECLYKRPKEERPELIEFRNRFRKAISQGDFQIHSISVEDLQEVQVLEKRKRLSKGELSSMVFAKKTNQAFMTDDQKARLLGNDYLGSSRVQTTPHLFGWLFYIGRLSDTDKDIIIQEHTRMGRPLGRYLEAMYHEALKLRLASMQEPV